MPLINCPDCNKEVSDKAGTCIHCGCPLSSNEQQIHTQHANTDLRKGILISCNAGSGGGKIKDIETEQTISFSPYEVAEKKLLRGYVGKTVDYVKVDGRWKIYAPLGAPVNEFLIQNSRSNSQSSSHNQTVTSNKADSENVTKNYLWYLMVLIVAAGYWIAKGTPNPSLFFAGSSAKEECLNLANENKGSIMLNDNEITANDTWLKDGKRVVQLLQKDEDNGLNQIMCIYGNGMVQIPSYLEQGRWR
jgi:hypothetical protein